MTSGMLIVRASARSVKTMLFSLLFFMLAAQSRGETPRLFREKPFNAAQLAEAVNHFVALGEESAIHELTELTPEHSYKRDRLGRFINVRDRVSWVCRILFQPKDNHPLEPPGYGGVPLPDMPLARWPILPIAHSGSSYFVLATGYRRVFGVVQIPQEYLVYCRRKGVFRTHPIPVPTRAQAQSDVLELRNSPAWKAIKWEDRWFGLGHSRMEERTWRFIQAQADSIK
jgi:hypothetical protein